MASPPQARRPRHARTFAAIAVAASLMLSGSAGYTVRAGDTLWTIASRLGVSVSSLASANGLESPHVIYPGQQLKVPGDSASSPAPSSSATTHVVKPGETLMGISIRYGVLMRHIAAANGFANLDFVYAGQRLKIPAGTVAPAAPAPAAATPAVAPVTTSRDDVGRMLDETARRYGFTPAFIKAIAYQESGWNQSARSSVGAVGVMQVMPTTGDFIERYLVGRPLDLTDTQDNITAGVAYVAYLWRLTGGDVDRTLAGYYQGLQSVADNGLYPSTKTYTANILALRERFR